MEDNNNLDNYQFLFPDYNLTHIEKAYPYIDIAILGKFPLYFFVQGNNFSCEELEIHF